MSVKGNGSIWNDLSIEVAMLKWRSEDDYFSANLNVTVFNYAARPAVITQSQYGDDSSGGEGGVSTSAYSFMECH